MRRLLPVLVLCTLVSCAKKEEDRRPPEQVEVAQVEMLDLNEAIVASPGGIVSATAPLDITFRDPAIPNHLEGTVLDRNPFAFNPEISGHAEWVSRKLLRFVPDERLPGGLHIEGVLNGKVAFGEQRHVNNFSFSFKIAEQEIMSISADFFPVPETLNKVRYTGTIEFAEPVDLDEIRKDISLTVDLKSVPVEVRAGDSPRKIKIESEVIDRINRGLNSIVYLPGKYSADHKDWRHSAFLPAAGVFCVLGHSDMTDEDSNVLTYGFRFNEPIREEIDLSGFVTVATDMPYEVRVNGKYLLIDGDFTPGRSYEVTIANGFPSAYGTKLVDDYTKSFALENLKPGVQWLDDGVYLPTDNEYKLQFKSVNVSRLRLRVIEIHPQNIGFFLQRNALVDNSEVSGDMYYGYDDLGRVGKTVFEDRVAVTEQRNKWIKTELDLTSVFEGKTNSVYVVDLKFDQNDLTGSCTNSREDLAGGDLYFEKDDYYSNPCDPGYYYSRGRSSKLLIASNVGLTVKKADSGTHVFATDVLTARPLSGLKLDLYTYQTDLIQSRTTDSDGHAFFDQTGAYILGRHESGIAVISDRHPKWQINDFDVDGSEGGWKGTNVFMYADRGVHRPGDTIHLSAIVRIERDVPPENLPVILSVTNPLGQAVHEARTQCGWNGHLQFPIETSLSDPTGDWKAKMVIGGQEFTKRLKVEMVKPFRLKVNVEVPVEVRAPEMVLRGRIVAKYLFGTPAANHKTEAKLTLSEKAFSPEKYRDFIFSTPMRRLKEMRLSAFEGALDETGSRRFRAELDGVSEAPQLVQAVLETKVFEGGGGFTTRNTPFTVYPRTAFVGLKNVFEGRSARIGEKYDIPMIVVDPDGRPVAGHNLKVSVYVNSRHWWWEYDRRDKVDFRKMESTYLSGEYAYTSQDKPIVHALSVEDAGRHLIEVTDLDSGHQAGLFFYGSRWGYEIADEQELNLVRIMSDKNVYNVGDEASITFDTPRHGMALLTVEQGERIIRSEWKAIEQDQTSFEFPVTPDMTPNCYVSVSLIQPHNQNTNDMPMRIYGIKTLYVEDSSTRLPLALTVPKEIRPNENFTVVVRSGAPRRASYTIAVVDEGLLDITAFDTPSPWDHFFEKIRLGVVTFDNFEQILGVLYPDIDRFFSIGGGMMDAERQKRLDRAGVQRFKPVALFEGPIQIEAGASVNTTFTMPNYVGSVRIMIIGTAGNSYAALEETAPVRQPLMVLPTVPRVARPGDVFSLPVSVFSMDSTLAAAEVSLSLSDNLKAIGPSVSRVGFDKPGERDTEFTVEVGDTVGAGKVRVSVTSGPHAANYEVDLPITSPNPFYTEVTDTIAVDGAPVTLTPHKFGLRGTNRARIAFTGTPDIQLQKRISFLINYPYGCIEQTVSAVFPQIFLPSLTDLNTRQRQAVTDNVNQAIKRLSAFELDKGFAFWPVSSRTESKYSDWGSTYAGHFLVEAKASGYHVPDKLFSHWLSSAAREAKTVNRENHRYQAYRLFVLALAGKPHIGAMNLLRENYLTSLDPLSRILLAASYHLSGNEDVARSIKGSSQYKIEGYRELAGTYGSALRDQALIAYLLVKMGDSRTASSLLRQVAASFGIGGWYSTQETAMAVLCVGAYHMAVPNTGGAITFTMKTGDGPAETLKLDGYQMVVDLDDVWGKGLTIVNEGGNPLYVTLFEEGVPLKNRVRTESNGMNLSRDIYDGQGNPTTFEGTRQDEPFWIVYTVTSSYSLDLEGIALSSVLPSGWEIMNTRLVEDGLPEWIKNLRVTPGKYMDVRDDRVNWFFDLSRKPVRFAVKVTPTFKGTYVLPPVVVESMYSPEFYSRIQGGSVKVR